MNHLLKELASDLKPFTSIEPVTSFLIKWGIVTAGITFFSLLILPIRTRMSDHLVEVFWWTTLSLSSALALYYQSFPQRTVQLPKLIAGISLFAICILILKDGSGIQDQSILREMSLWRGRCGFIILALALIHTPFLFKWARNGASQSPALSGLWASLSSSALGCLLMQFVCLHENSLHLVLWHFFPLTIFCFLGQLAGRKLLRW